LKDFDVIRAERVNADRSFRLGGEEFKFRPSVAAGVRVAFEDEAAEATTSRAVLAAIDKYILNLLEPGQEEKWAAVRDDSAEFPVSFKDLEDVYQHIEAVLTGRPTERPSDSGGRPSQTGTGSRDGSSSQAPIPVALT
jgi:hypothetical protein